MPEFLEIAFEGDVIFIKPAGDATSIPFSALTAVNEMIVSHRTKDLGALLYDPAKAQIHDCFFVIGTKADLARLAQSDTHAAAVAKFRATLAEENCPAQVIEWLVASHNGQSSSTLLVKAGAFDGWVPRLSRIRSVRQVGGTRAAPRDAADRQRCLDTIEMFPQAATALDEIIAETATQPDQAEEHGLWIALRKALADRQQAQAPA